MEDKQLQVCREPTCTTNDYGDKEWYLDGQLHREAGPAVEWADAFSIVGRSSASGNKHWYLDGKRLTEAEHAAATKPGCDQKTVVIDGLTYRLVLDESTQQMV